MFAEIDWVALFEAAPDLLFALFVTGAMVTAGVVVCTWVVAYYVSVLVRGWPPPDSAESED